MATAGTTNMETIELKNQLQLNESTVKSLQELVKSSKQNEIELEKKYEIL